MGEVLSRVKPEYLRRAYKLAAWADAEDFLAQAGPGGRVWGQRGPGAQAGPGGRGLGPARPGGAGRARGQGSGASEARGRRPSRAVRGRRQADRLARCPAAHAAHATRVAHPQVARQSGKLTRGGEPDLNTAARMVLYDWQRGGLLLRRRGWHGMAWHGMRAASLPGAAAAGPPQCAAAVSRRVLSPPPAVRRRRQDSVLHPAARPCRGGAS